MLSIATAVSGSAVAATTDENRMRVTVQAVSNKDNIKAVRLLQLNLEYHALYGCLMSHNWL